MMKQQAWVWGLVVALASWGCGKLSETNNSCDLCGEAGTPTASKPTKPGSSNAGTAGTSSSVGDGSGGGAAAPSSDPFHPHCDQQLAFASECSFQETCKLLSCGDGLSALGDDGCRRSCVASSDCAAGQRCRFTFIPGNCAPSLIAGCVREADGSCACGASKDCTTPDICVDEKRYPAADDCVVEGVSCGDLLDWQKRLAVPGEASSEKISAIESCRRAIQAQRVTLACSDVFTPSCDEPLEFGSECSFEDTCKALGCGNGVSEFGADGCRRLCTTSADCGAGERCRHTALVTNEEECATGGDYEGCSYENGSCSCSQDASCEYPNVCVDATKYPPSQDCMLEGATCTALAYLADNSSYLVAHPDPEPDVTAQAKSCLEAVEAQRAAFNCAK